MKTKFRKYNEHCKLIDKLTEDELSPYYWDSDDWYESDWYDYNYWYDDSEYRYDKNGFCVAPLTKQKLRELKMGKILNDSV